ncbi:hypothetical protein GXP67_18950 [Rhodocytophaga rosea]|uniref:Uncharacterized protein n=1 Tax=Rhodocytophaga rosea TaxID=2704465 RepID=A0A6C0GL81_9BACT|nr:hypothetical protein [Rhodocytophaga rosea]QHT68574.1 hypothetical protein GXP67_18950 [Rhodocytophaga rosea]
MIDYIKELKLFIDKEYDEKNRQIEETWAKPLKERIAAGEAIGNIFLKIKGMRIKGYSSIISDKATLECNENTSKFRKGSKVILHKGNPKSTVNTFSYEILEDKGLVLEVKLQQQGYCHFPLEIQNTPNWILDSDKVDIREIVKQH